MSWKARAVFKAFGGNEPVFRGPIGMVKRFLVWLGFHIHDWSEWRETHTTKTSLKLGIVQRRDCTLCKKAQLRTVWTQIY